MSSRSSSRSERPLYPREINAGYKHYEGSITIEIVEVAEVPQFPSGKAYMIAYRIIDGDYVSPVAHLFVSSDTDLKKEFKRVVDFYNQVKSSILGRR